MNAEKELILRIDDLQRQATQSKEELSALDQQLADIQNAIASAEAETERCAKELAETIERIEISVKEVQSLENSLGARRNRIAGLRAELETETSRVCVKMSSGEETK